ncbi:MAG: hypothetical protein ABJA49_03900 [Betaproteobacteria bacterium]
MKLIKACTALSNAGGRASRLSTGSVVYPVDKQRDKPGKPHRPWVAGTCLPDRQVRQFHGLRLNASDKRAERACGNADLDHDGLASLMSGPYRTPTRPAACR